jgi:hypothetical protein
LILLNAGAGLLQGLDTWLLRPAYKVKDGAYYSKIPDNYSSEKKPREKLTRATLEKGRSLWNIMSNSEDEIPTVDLGEALEFTYTPLDPTKEELRLIKFHYNPHGSGPIFCSLQHFDLTTAPKCKALSCVWGESAIQDPIIVNGGFFLIGTNLYDFLLQMPTDRDFCQNTQIWIDQICIQQSNLLENNHQVQ